VRRALLALALAACGGAAPRSPTTPATATPAAEPTAASPAGPRAASGAPAVDCDAIRKNGIAQGTAGKLDDAIATFEHGLAACGDGHGFHNLLGLALATRHQIDDAAKHYIAELGAPNAAPSTFSNLNSIYDQLTADRKAEIAALGATESAPIKVPEIRFEYAWVGRFACPDGAGKVKSQALLHTKTGQLDLLVFDCPGGKEHQAYFDFSDDPTEKSMREQLQQLKDQDGGSDRGKKPDKQP